MQPTPSLGRTARRLTGSLLAVALAAVLADAPAARAQARFNLGEARKSVVFVRRVTPGLAPAVGTGFLVSKDGLIYTNRHVALPADETLKGSILLVGVPSPKDPDVLDYFKAEVAYAPQAKEDLDFAVLKIAGRRGVPAFKALPLAGAKAELGGDVAVLGYPLVAEDQPNLSFNKGSISSSRVRIRGRSYYQTDAAVNPGNSGGPLLNDKGAVVGIVTLKKQGAENIGFALYLEEVKAAAALARQRAARLKPEPGPLDPRKLPTADSLALKKDNWELGGGTVREGKGGLVLDNDGGTYWVTSKKPLPENFQLVIRCRIEFLKGRQVIYVSQRNILRMLCVRFATAETKADIMERKGNLVQFSHALLLLWKEGEVVKNEAKGNEEEPFTLTVTKQGGDYTIAVDGEILLKHHDDKPLKAAQKFSIGGYLSRLHLAEVAVIDLGAGKGGK